MRQANAQHNWVHLNVPPFQPSASAPNQDITGATANQAGLSVLTGNLFSTRGPHGPSTRYAEQLGDDEPEQQGGFLEGGVGGPAIGMCDIINVYISMQGADGLEHPHMEYDVSVLRALIGEALTHILAHGGRAAQVLREMDHSRFTVSTSTCPLPLCKGGGDDLSFWEISTLDNVLRRESPHFSTPLRRSRACPETVIVAEETQLSCEEIYVVYIHRTDPGAYSPPLPTSAGTPTALSAPTTASGTNEMPEWAHWDIMFLDSIKPMAPLFDQSYGEAFKVYAAVSAVIGIARELNTVEKKPMGMGKDGRLPGVLAWLKARVGIHKLTIFERSPRTFERYFTFWHHVQKLSLQLSQTIFGNSEYDRDRSNILDMLIVWQNIPTRVGQVDAEPTTAELPYLTNSMSLKKAEELLRCDPKNQ
ncbi:hypothetical protein IW261DRAFT_1566354 [Armillaria novae-zelandiae]|uniref:Uncharacterized protein n=1 Tax=Armillaria novae-zelandiae TaxID=153914 RepID=A0AA39U8X9_9AGAR|nr:hypothetical protein IW261DRAFT_1566354 [Armillaria novae-zelandiae]